MASFKMKLTEQEVKNIIIESFRTHPKMKGLVDLGFKPFDVSLLADEYSHDICVEISFQNNLEQEPEDEHRRSETTETLQIASEQLSEETED